MGRSLDAKVSSIIHIGGWWWPRRSNGVIAEIINNIAATPLPFETNEDRVVWTLSPLGIFAAKSAWLVLRTRASEVPWHAIVWHKGSVPRWAFILWVAIWGRLATRDRLRTWGVTLDSGCVLCDGGIESHNHLFFDCSYALQVWNEVKSRCGYARTFSSLSLSSPEGFPIAKGHV